MIASASGSQLAQYAFGAANVIFVVGTQKLVPDLATARERIYRHSLPLEDARALAAYGMNSRVGKVLETPSGRPGPGPRCLRSPGRRVLTAVAGRRASRTVVADYGVKDSIADGSDHDVLRETERGSRPGPSKRRCVGMSADPKRWQALAVLGIAFLMVILDVAIVNVALPSIQKDLHFSSASSLQWVVSGYALDLRRPDPARRPPGRHPRPQARVHGRPRLRSRRSPCCAGFRPLRRS